jgi:hypothetical protein
VWRDAIMVKGPRKLGKEVDILENMLLSIDHCKQRANPHVD